MILLIGATGQLGSDLLRNNRQHDIYAPSRDELDLTRLEQVSRMLHRLKPQAIINCAAFHNVPLCEDQPQLAFHVNCVAVRHMALLAKEIDCSFFTFSSDYVFGGDINRKHPYYENDPPSPLQMYGITRLAGEQVSLFAAPEHTFVIRTCGLYGRSGSKAKAGNFVSNRLADAGAIQRIEMSYEQIVCPTSTDDLSRAVLNLVDHPQRTPGIYHLVNEGECSWYEFTRAILEIKGLHTEVVPVDRGGRSGRMRRPFYSVLGNTRARALGIILRPWRQALREYLEFDQDQHRSNTE